MKRIHHLCLALLSGFTVCCFGMWEQTTPPSPASPPAPSTIQARSNLAIVDVVVSDHNVVPDALVANVRRFEAEQASAKTQLCVRYTLDAMNGLPRYLCALPGRKAPTLNNPPNRFCET